MSVWYTRQENRKGIKIPFQPKNPQSKEPSMKKTKLWLSGLFTFLIVLLNIQPALAHESITVGNYEIVVGWATEPPIAGQMNAIEIRVSDTSSGTEQPVEDVALLTLTISYGGQEKTLTLEPVGEDSPGRFIAPVLPTIAGEYVVIFGGTLGDTTVDAETHVQEVQPADILSFPIVDSAQPETTTFGLTEWLAIAALVSGLVALILSIYNLIKANDKKAPSEQRR
jgi:hypothetical protein